MHVEKYKAWKRYLKAMKDDKEKFTPGATKNDEEKYKKGRPGAMQWAAGWSEFKPVVSSGWPGDSMSGNKDLKVLTAIVRILRLNEVKAGDFFF